MRAVIAVFAVCSLTSCAPRTPADTYQPAPSRAYGVERDAAVDAVLTAIQDLGFVVDNVGGLANMSVITTAERQSEDNDEDGLECKEEWRGIAYGGWVEETGGVVLTVQITDADTGGSSIGIRESGVRGCEPTGEWSDRFYGVLDQRLTRP